MTWKWKEVDKPNKTKMMSPFQRFIYNKGEGKIHDVKCRHFTIAICINFSPLQDLGDCSKYLLLSEAWQSHCHECLPFGRILWVLGFLKEGMALSQESGTWKKWFTLSELLQRDADSFWKLKPSLLWVECEAFSSSSVSVWYEEKLPQGLHVSILSL